MNRLTTYFRATFAELKQVSWPSQKQALLYTLLVIVISGITALYVGAFDYLFSQGLNLLINAF